MTFLALPMSYQYPRANQHIENFLLDLVDMYKYLNANNSHLQQIDSQICEPPENNQESSMRYLCPKHQQHILQNPRLAKTLWNGAMESGVIAYRQQRWQTARNFFGSAYETTLLYMWNTPIVDKTTFSIEHLIDAGQLLSSSLKKLKAWDEAQICLLTLQNNLLPLNNIHHSSSPLNREKVLNLTNDFVSALIESLNLQTHLKHNDCLLSTTRDQHTDNQNSIDNKHQITSAPINKVH